MIKHNQRITEYLTREEAQMLYRVRNVKDGRVQIGVTRRRGAYRVITVQRERGHVEIIHGGDSVVERFGK